MPGSAVTRWTEYCVQTSEGIRKIMVGRKRKTGNREPNGRVQRDRGIDPKAIAQLQPHRRLVPAGVAHDPKAECVMGRLCLNGWISETQYQAGVKYRTLVMNYRRVIGAPRSTEASMSGVIVGPWAGGGEMPEDRQIEIRNAYMRAFEALQEHPDNRCARDVSHCVIQDRTNFTLAVVKSGLNALALHFGLTNRTKRDLSHK